MVGKHYSILVSKDDIGEYAHWKSFLALNKLPEIEKKEKKKQQHLLLTNKLIAHAKLKVTAREKLKVPLSKQVEIINKWKDLDHADRELAVARKNYNVRHNGNCLTDQSFSNPI